MIKDAPSIPDEKSSQVFDKAKKLKEERVIPSEVDDAILELLKEKTQKILQKSFLEKIHSSKKSVFSNIERLIDASEHDLVRSELNSILNTLKTYY